MKEEIKEILEKLKENISIVSIEEEHLLLDYITNLQEEIERESKAQVILDNQIAEMWKYKQRNEKAIEKLESIRAFGLRSGKTLFSTLINETIDILKGDKDE